MEEFDKWLEDFKREAITKGISQSTLEVLKDAKPIKKTIKLDNLEEVSKSKGSKDL